jgi:hypothetical protein
MDNVLSREETLFASGSTTNQKVEQAVSDEERAEAQLAASVKPA